SATSGRTRPSGWRPPSAKDLQQCVPSTSTSPSRTNAMASSSDDPVAALNEVLSEVIDLVQDVKQAHRKVPDTHALHAEIDQLSADLRAWARLLTERDEALGLSALD